MEDGERMPASCTPPATLVESEVEGSTPKGTQPFLLSIRWIMWSREFPSGVHSGPRYYDAGAEETAMESRPNPHRPRGTCFAWGPSRNHHEGPMLTGTGPSF